MKTGKMNGLDLFSGIGGLSIALNEWVRPIAYCEIDTYCQGVLLSQIQRGTIQNAPIFTDIRILEGDDLPTGINIIYGGFPCQDISIAGRGKGLAGERSGLVREIYRLAEEIKPKFIFLENVPAITSRGGISVVRTLTEMGYDCRWCVISAASVGALHRRERWFLLGYSKHNGRDGIKVSGSDETSVLSCKKGKDEAIESEGTGTSSMLADTQSIGQQEVRQSQRQEERQPMLNNANQYGSVNDWQEAVSSVCRVTDGIPQRVDRIRALGNAVVPEQAKEAFKILMGYS